MSSESTHDPLSSESDYEDEDFDGYNYASSGAFYDDDQDWAFCDKDCGWCGHCGDGVDY